MSIDFETSEQQNQLPTYQKVEDIELREDEGADLEVWVRDGEDPVAKAREQLELNNWWLSARWQEKVCRKNSLFGKWVTRRLIFLILAVPCLIKILPILRRPWILWLQKPISVQMVSIIF